MASRDPPISLLGHIHVCLFVLLGLCLIALGLFGLHLRSPNEHTRLKLYLLVFVIFGSDLFGYRPNLQQHCRSNRSARSGARPTVERVESRVRHPTLIGSAPPPRAKDHRRHSHHRDHADGSEGPRFHGPDWRLFFKPAAKPRAAPAYAGFSVVVSRVLGIPIKTVRRFPHSPFRFPTK